MALSRRQLQLEEGRATVAIITIRTRTCPYLLPPGVFRSISVIPLIPSFESDGKFWNTNLSGRKAKSNNARFRNLVVCILHRKTSSMVNSIILHQSSRRSLKREKKRIFAIEHSETNEYINAKFFYRICVSKAIQLFIANHILRLNLPYRFDSSLE